MSMVELRRNSSPHLRSLHMSASPPAWRKTSHPPLNGQQRHQSLFLLNSQQENELDDPELSPTLSHRSVSPGVYHRMLSHCEDLKGLVRSITTEAKCIIKAETCSLFLIDKQNKELVAPVFDKADNLSEIRIPLDRGVVGRVATTKTMMNVRNVHRCPFFYAHVDELTGFQTRSILCFPVIDHAGVFVGVLELCNKEGKSGFSRNDENKARSFAVYCASSLSHCLLYRKVQEAQRRTHMAGEYGVSEGAFTATDQDIEEVATTPIRPWQHWHAHFDHFEFPPRSIGNSMHYVNASMTMFEDLGFIQRYNLDQRILANFVVRVASGYREVPYHNWTHAFAVAHFCWLALKTPAIRSGLEEMERLSLLVACLCHDIDHRGTNNRFQLQTKTPLAQLYSSNGSVLEHHHYAQTVIILNRPECNILQNLTRSQYQQVLNHIRSVILATDIAAHMAKVPRIQQMVRDGYNPLSHDHHYLFMCLIMTASDLSDQSKNFHNSKAIAEQIYREFFSQGDMEKQLGEEPMPMMDREKAAHVPQIQMEFMDTVAVPVFQMLADIVPECVQTYESISYNRKCWEALGAVITKQNQPADGLEFLKDDKVEEDVVQLVARQQQEHRLKEQKLLTNHTNIPIATPR